MRKLILLVFLFFTSKGIYAQEYYYYKGTRINLEQRTDKAAVVLNSNFFSKEFIDRSISDAVNSDCEIKEVAEQFYLINFEEKKSASEIHNLCTKLSERGDLIKFVTPVYYGESKKVTQIPTDEIIVRLRNNNNKEFLDIINAENNLSIVGNVSDEKGFLLKSNNGVIKNALELSKIYFNSGLFEYCEPNFVYPEFCLLNYTPNDPLYSKQWALNNTGQAVPTGGFTEHGDQLVVNALPGADLDLNLAWDITKGSSSIRVGVLDTGIDSTHPDFNASGHLLTGYDAYFNKYGVPNDSGFFGGHGTCTAGIIGALINNSLGTAGVAPECKLMSFRIFNPPGTTSNIQMSRAFDTARVLGIEVLSNSWTGGTPSSTLTNAINNAALNGRGGLGCVILFCSGNDGHNSVWYPSYLSNVVCVGASTTHDQKKAPGTGNNYWWGGNYGEDGNGDLDVVAPSICYTTDIQGAYGYKNISGPEGDYFDSFRGTSCSCPHAAGIIALMLSVNPSLTRLEAMDKLYRGCEKIDNMNYSTSKAFGKWNEYCGYGRVNAYNSVRLAAGVDVTPPTINHKNIYSHSSTYPTLITAEIIDQDGSPVPSYGSDQPKLFYRLNKNNTGWSSFNSIVAFANSGNYFTFKVPCQGYETQVQYYIKATDLNANYSTFPHGAPDNFWLCYYSIGSFVNVSNKIDAFNCSEAGVTYSPVVNFDNFTIVNTKVEIYLQHGRMSDEIIELYSPISDANNNRKCLFSSNGGSGANISGAVIVDSAIQFWKSGTPPYTNGVFKGDYVLNGLNGTSAQGEWKILNYDPFIGFAANFDSIIISLTKTSGVSSACARLNSPEDSVLYFGQVFLGDSLVKDFYLKNSGTADLNITDITFSGSDSSEFSLINSFPGLIAPGDSGLFKVQLKNITNSVSEDTITSAILNIQTNDPSKNYFRVSLQIDDSLELILRNLHLTALIEGFYDATSNSSIPDSASVYLRNSTPPFDVVDSAHGIINQSGEGSFDFSNIQNGTNFFITIKHRNALETWSSGVQSFDSSLLAYDFTTDSSKAFGGNLALKGTKYCLYSGDVNQTGNINLEDILLVFNSSNLFSSGYIAEDLDGNNVINLQDIILAYNNASKFISLIRP